MTIIEHLKRRSLAGADDALVRSLTSLAEFLSERADAHLKQVIAQQPNFDLHDGSHSSHVARNIELMLGEGGLQSSSSYDLFFLQTASYLHDCAMALPQWEHNVLRLAEYDVASGSKEDAPANESKEALGFEAAAQLIRSQLRTLVGSDKAPLEWLFAPGNEQALINDLAERLRAYQTFRNGYRNELISAQGDSELLLARSNELRLDFIRRTHHTRIETWVRNLERFFEERLGGAWGKALAHDLAAICRSHGEGEDFVRSLPRSSRYLGDSPCNPQLAALLLRLGDITDFSSERAPLMLYLQKQIKSQISRDHWEVKNQGINYSFGASSDGVIGVRYSAYFQIPRLYFLFEDYLDMVDDELALYERLTTSKRNNDAFERAPQLASKADRSGIRYDASHFEPVTGLRFSLDQKRILELLMGVKLYKDPFACLRELYQNSLDATRCMIASEEYASRKGTIEFGLGADSQGHYAYCRDNGIGMTRDVVSRFFLRVGNSYYRSQEFQRAAARWATPFTPVSQFGIGILSCFMIGTRMEILSKPLPGLHESSDPICFVIDSPQEHFYYRPLSASELEFVGRHGTVVKVFLREEFRAKLHAKTETDAPFWQHCAGALRSTDLHEKVAEWEQHIYRRLSGFIGDYPQHIEVSARCENGSRLNIVRSTTPFDYQKLGIAEDLVKIWDTDHSRWRRDEMPYLDIYPYIECRQLTVETKGIAFTTILGLPKPQFPTKDSTALDAIRFLGRGLGVLIDGISVDSNRGSREDIDLFSHSGILNFTGALRPVLSVDRLSIVEWPKGLDLAVEALRGPLATQLVDAALGYTAQSGLADDSDEILLLWDHIFSKYGFITKELVGEILKRSEANFLDLELSRITNRSITLREFGEAAELMLNFGKLTDFKRRTIKMVTGKLVAASEILVGDAGIQVRGSNFAVLDDDEFWGLHHSREYILRADKWLGKCQEFDLISTFWPVVSAPLFDRLGHRFGEVAKVNDRTKEMHHYSNSISALVQLDPTMIHHRLGTYTFKTSFLDRKPESLVYKFEDARNDFWLNELDPNHDLHSKKERYCIVVYIAPRELNSVEREELKRYDTDDPEYVRGVSEGWSILGLGDRELNVVCAPGRLSRDKLVERIPESFWKRHAAWKFRFLDGSRLRDLEA